MQTHHVITDILKFSNILTNGVHRYMLGGAKAPALALWTKQVPFRKFVFSFCLFVFFGWPMLTSSSICARRLKACDNNAPINIPSTPPAHTSVNVNAQSGHKRRRAVAADSAQLQPNTPPPLPTSQVTHK